MQSVNPENNPAANQTIYTTARKKIQEKENKIKERYDSRL